MFKNWKDQLTWFCFILYIWWPFCCNFLGCLRIARINWHTMLKFLQCLGHHVMILHQVSVPVTWAIAVHSLKKLIYLHSYVNCCRLQCWETKWSYTLSRFKAYTHIAALPRWKCSYCHHLHFEPSTKPCRTIPEYALLRYPSKGSDK